MEGWQQVRRKSGRKKFSNEESKARAPSLEESFESKQYRIVSADYVDGVIHITQEEVKESSSSSSSSPSGGEKPEICDPNIGGGELLNEIKGPDGKRVYIEYEYGYPEDVTEGIPIGHPSYETVLSEGSGEFYYFFGNNYKSWVFGWYGRPDYYSSDSYSLPKQGQTSRPCRACNGRCNDGDDDDDDDDDDDYVVKNPYILGERD